MSSAASRSSDPAEGPLSQITMRSTASLIAERLRAAIMLGELAPGAQLGEADLAEQFGVSRGPLREAIQRLVQEGLLIGIKNRGMYVTRLSTEDIVDIYTAREAIETAAALRILALDSTNSIARLREAYAGMTAAADRDDAPGLSGADQHFHEVLVDESQSTRLRRMASTVLVETRICMTALAPYEMPQEALREHEEIITAIESRDEDTIRRALHNHMATGIRLLSPPAVNNGSE